jgi:hypothetical protein
LGKARPSSIDRITHQRVSYVGHVDTDLVGSAGFKIDLNQRMSLKTFFDAVMRDGRFSIAMHGKALSVRTVTPNREVDGAAARERALNQRQILAMHRVSLKLLDQNLVSLNGSGNHQKAARILVDTVHDAGSWHLVEFRGEMQECILKGAIVMARRGMYHQSLGLVDDENGVIFVDHRQRNGFRGDCRDRLKCRRQDNGFSAKYFSLRFCGQTLHGNGAVPNPVLDAVAGVLGEKLAQCLIQSFSSKVQRDLGGKVRWGIHFSPLV